MLNLEGDALEGPENFPLGPWLAAVNQPLEAGIHGICEGMAALDRAQPKALGDVLDRNYSIAHDQIMSTTRCSTRRKKKAPVTRRRRVISTPEMISELSGGAVSPSMDQRKPIMKAAMGLNRK